MKKYIVLAILLLLLPSAAFGNIDILDLSTSYDGIAHYGYVDYSVLLNQNATVWVLLSIDSENLFWESVELKVTLDESKCFFIPTEGTVKFPINRTEGTHNVEVTFIVDLLHRNATCKYVIDTPIVVEEVKTDNLSGYPQIDSDVMRVVKITEEIGSLGMLVLRLEVEYDGKTYTFGARAKDYYDDEMRGRMVEHWVERIEEAKWRP